MSCQYLSGRQIKMCAAFEGSLVLNVGELCNCTTSNYQHCKIYRRAHKDGGKLALRDYRAIYPMPSV